MFTHDLHSLLIGFRIQEQLHSGETLVSGDNWPIFVPRMQVRPQEFMGWPPQELVAFDGSFDGMSSQLILIPVSGI